MVRPTHRACPWRVRDLEGWRAEILFDVSAQLLVAWSAASTSSAVSISPTPYHALQERIEQVRQARLAGAVNVLEVTCRQVLAVARQAQTPEPFGVFLADLEAALAEANLPDACLIHHRTCSTPCPATSSSGTSRGR